MLLECQNHYQLFRILAGLTQEQAAERVELSVESLRAYESGRRVPGIHTVEAMAEWYGARQLVLLHLREVMPLYRELVPEVKPRSLIEAALRIHNRMRRLEEDNAIHRLLEIAEDGIIDTTERPEFDAILAEVWELVRVGLELSLTEEDRQVAG